MTLFDAIENGDAQRARKLLGEGVDPDAGDEFNLTPLHCAAEKGNVEMVILLLEHGADPNVEDSSGRTPMSYIEQDGHIEIAKNLRHYGAADPHIRGAQLYQYDTPVYPITMNGNTIDKAVERPDGYESKYVLIQTMTGPEHEVEAYACLGYPSYISRNTYLGRYDGALGDLFDKQNFVFVEFYPKDLKTTTYLKQLPHDQTCEVDVIFHTDVEPGSELQEEIASVSHCAVEDIQFFKHKARLTIQGCWIEDVAAIDSVRYIKPVSKIDLV
ncbi:ankyrin repeat-containing domain protein [Hypomontagnella monticulosa]|nr:ankyrin repeat-containing domain protein [Hypomontagnella monticulosa]